MKPELRTTAYHSHLLRVLFFSIVSFFEDGLTRGREDNSICEKIPAVIGSVNINDQPGAAPLQNIR